MALFKKCSAVLTLGLALATNALCIVQENTPANSPAQVKIAEARVQIKNYPDRFQGYNNLALAMVRRARETADPSFYKEAEQNVSTGLRLAPNDSQLLKTRVAILLGQHDYPEALRQAVALNHRIPDDVIVYGYLADADIALGDYPAAEKSAQWMLNLLRNNIPGLLIAAKLREVYGDPEGAFDMLNQAYGETSPVEMEDLAWIANRIAEIKIETGRLDQAERVLEQAQKLFPGYQDTQINLARLRIAQGRYADAVELLNAGKVSTPEGLYLTAEAWERSGKPEQAKSAWAAFVTSAREAGEGPDSANAELVLYYADHKMGREALELAQQQIALRHDVPTLDAYAWALYANAKYADAAAAMDKTLAVGVRDPGIFYQAANIALKSGDTEKARQYLASALQVDPASFYAGMSSKMLAALPADPGKHVPVVTAAATTGRTQTSPAHENAPVPVQPAESTFPVAKPLQPVAAALLLPGPTATDRDIHVAQLQVERSPADASAYAKLGAAFFQKARETGDVDNYDKAEKALLKSLDLVSNDLSATGPDLTLSEVYMGEHRFKEALTYAQRALALGSGDLSPFGIVGDAETDMGDYDDGAVAYSKLEVPGARMVPGSAYVRESRVSYLRFIHGKSGEAVALMQAAVAEGIQAQLPRENLAWLYVELGEDYFRAGNVGAADGAFYTGLSIYPGNYRALAGLGKARASEGRYAEAIQFYKSAVAVVPMPTFVAALGDLYTKTGETKEAAHSYQLVEYIGMLGKINQVLHNRDLALFYADHDRNLPEALTLAKKELEVRQDIYTWDTLAWALYKNGKLSEANDAMQKAMQFHTEDALLYFHAGMIQKALGDAAAASTDLRESLKINPQFDVVYADMARQQLATTQVADGKSGDAH